MRKKKLFIGILILILSAVSFSTLVAKDKNIPEESSSIQNIYTQAIDYLRKERGAETSFNFTVKEFIIFFVIDLSLSLFCLWAAVLLLVAVRVKFEKTLPWFLFIFNFTWLFMLLLFRLAWMSFGLLLVRLQADLAPILIDNFSFFIIIIACLIYIWLLARTFSLNFFGALGVFLASHIFYFLIIFLLFSFVTIKENRFFNLAKENLGIKPVIRSYLSDVNNVTSDKGVLDLIRIRAFHL